MHAPPPEGGGVRLGLEAGSVRCAADLQLAHWRASISRSSSQDGNCRPHQRPASPIRRWSRYKCTSRPMPPEGVGLSDPLSGTPNMGGPDSCYRCCSTSPAPIPAVRHARRNDPTRALYSPTRCFSSSSPKHASPDPRRFDTSRTAPVRECCSPAMRLQSDHGTYPSAGPSAGVRADWRPEAFSDTGKHDSTATTAQSRAAFRRPGRRQW